MDGRAHGSLRIIGLYVPCAGSADADLGASIRAQLEADISDRDARTTLVAGDMNAALYPSDRTVGEESPRTYTHDRAHRAAMEGLRVAPVDALPASDATRARLKTFRRQGKGLISRIDDVLTTVPQEELANMRGEVEVQTHCMEGASTDHDALEVRLPWAALGMEPLQDLPPLPRGPPTKLLKLPMSQEDKQRLTQALREKLGPELADLQAELLNAREKDLDPHNAYLLQKDPGERHRLATIQGAPAHQWIDQVSEKLCDILQKAQALAIAT